MEMHSIRLCVCKGCEFELVYWLLFIHVHPSVPAIIAGPLRYSRSIVHVVTTEPSNEVRQTSRKVGRLRRRRNYKESTHVRPQRCEHNRSATWNCCGAIQKLTQIRR